MAHKNAYESTFTKRSMELKKRAKEKSSKINLDSFVVDKCDDYAVVIEVKYDKAYVLYNNQVLEVMLTKDLNQVCNKIIFPGDKVIIKDKIITNLIKRTSILSRVKKDRSRIMDIGENKLIATNIDIGVIVVSPLPMLHPKFIDRYLMILQNNNITPIICLNKSDLKTNEDEILDIYIKIGIKVIETSTILNTGIEELKQILLNHQAILVGNSGVGKSSLANTLTNNNIKVGEIGSKTKRGCHTTTSSKYYIWDDNSSIIDTPGIRSLDVSSFNINEIEEYFPEFNKFKNCKYKDCLHYNESIKDCTIKQAVNNNLINKERYNSYIRIIESFNK